MHTLVRRAERRQKCYWSRAVHVQYFGEVLEWCSEILALHSVTAEKSGYINKNWKVGPLVETLFIPGIDWQVNLDIECKQPPGKASKAMEFEFPAKQCLAWLPKFVYVLCPNSLTRQNSGETYFGQSAGKVIFILQPLPRARYLNEELQRKPTTRLSDYPETTGVAAWQAEAPPSWLAFGWHLASIWPAFGEQRHVPQMPANQLLP